MRKYYTAANNLDIILEYRKEKEEGYEDSMVRLIDYETVVTLASSLTYGNVSAVKTVVKELHQLASTLLTVANDLEEMAKEEE